LGKSHERRHDARRDDSQHNDSQHNEKCALRGIKTPSIEGSYDKRCYAERRYGDSF